MYLMPCGRDAKSLDSIEVLEYQEDACKNLSSLHCFPLVKKKKKKKKKKKFKSS